jgi:osmoprotectant transport system ATP-binding protein
MGLVSFNNVSHKYNGTAALNGLTFDIEDHKITAIIGRSGSGKSTLLQIINGLIKPTQGDVLIFNNKIDYKNINETRLKIGYSVQGTGLFPHMTVYENISLLGKIQKEKKHMTERRVDMLMSLVNLAPGFKSKYPFELSGGEQQRVGICRAMLLNPPIFLLDEAFGALDVTTKNEIHAELLNLQKVEPRTIVLVTHDLSEAVKLGDNIMILEQGVIQQYDAKEKILSSPANDFVKNFIQIN